ncbi:hypothetical protein DFH09DRAFT_1311579 [Mycena vulgaris]|nr:hypothetical protein DFH09DRAFT_1311579 [Mycena vulgaris]
MTRPVALLSPLPFHRSLPALISIPSPFLSSLPARPASTLTHSSCLLIPTLASIAPSSAHHVTSAPSPPTCYDIFAPSCASTLLSPSRSWACLCRDASGRMPPPAALWGIPCAIRASSLDDAASGLAVPLPPFFARVNPFALPHPHPGRSSPLLSRTDTLCLLPPPPCYDILITSCISTLRPPRSFVRYNPERRRHPSALEHPSAYTYSLWPSGHRMVVVVED